MTKRRTALTITKSLRLACDADPFDTDSRLVLADALEDAGKANEAAVQRLIVEFVATIRKVLATGAYPCLVGAADGPLNTRIIVKPTLHPGQQSLLRVYAWVRRRGANAGGVYRGSWSKPEGPLQFWLADGASVWAQHIDTFGLRYLNDL